MHKHCLNSTCHVGWFYRTQQVLKWHVISAAEYLIIQSLFFLINHLKAIAIVHSSARWPESARMGTAISALSSYDGVMQVT